MSGIERHVSYMVSATGIIESPEDATRLYSAWKWIAGGIEIEIDDVRVNERATFYCAERDVELEGR